jgi:hypothetical protein
VQAEVSGTVLEKFALSDKIHAPAIMGLAKVEKQQIGVEQSNIKIAN